MGTSVAPRDSPEYKNCIKLLAVHMYIQTTKYTSKDNVDFNENSTEKEAKQTK